MSTRGGVDWVSTVLHVRGGSLVCSGKCGSDVRDYRQKLKLCCRSVSAGAETCDSTIGTRLAPERIVKLTFVSRLRTKSNTSRSRW